MDELKCPKCDSRIRKKGFEIYATPPHKRQKYQCTECGYPFVLEVVQEITDES